MFGDAEEGPEAKARPGLRAEAAECLWAVGCLALFALFGAVAGSALHVAAYLRLRAGRRVAPSVAIGFATGAALALIFEALLDVRLARGLAFDGWSGVF